MKNSKSACLISLALTLFFCVSVMFTGCNNGRIDADASSVPTHIPADKFTEPTIEPTVEPNDDPAVYSHIQLEEGVSVICDIDMNGIDDEVRYDDLSAYMDSYIAAYRITINLGSESGEAQVFTQTHTFANVNLATVAIVECDPNDGRLEVIACYAFDSDNYITYAYRVTADGNAISESHIDAGLCGGEAKLYFENGALNMFVRTDILGTTDVFCQYTIDSDGFKLISEYYSYAPNVPVGVIAAFTANAVNEDGTIEEFVLTPGMTIVPLQTDCRSYVLVKIPDGRNAVISIEFPGDTSFPYINGQPQHDFLDVHYVGKLY